MDILRGHGDVCRVRMRQPVLWFLLVCLLASSATSASSGRKKPRPFTVSTVTVHGNASFAVDLLFDRMITRSAWLWNKVEYSPLVLEDDIGVLKSFYRNQGFLDVGIGLDSVVADSVRKHVAVFITINERTRTYIKEIRFTGNLAYPDSELVALIRSKKGKPLISTQIEDDTRTIRTLLTGKGLLHAVVDHTIAFTPGADSAAIVIQCREGRCVRTGGISTSGLDNVKRELVFKTLSFSSGDTLSATTMHESSRRLYGTDLFSRVEIKPVPDDAVAQDDTGTGPAIQDVMITLVESRMFQVEGGVGYGSYDYFRGSAGLSYKNLFGIGKRATVGGQLSIRRQRGEIGYSDPRLFWTPVLLDINSYYGHHNEPGYSANIGGFKTGLGITTRRRNLYRLIFRWEEVRNLIIKDAADTTTVNLVSMLRTQSVTGMATFDRRDDFMNPTRGAYLDLRLEIAGMGGTSRFYKSVADGRVYLSWLKLVFASGITAGFAHQYGNSTDVPPTEQFTMRNTGIMRGFPEDKKTADTALTGGRLLLIIHPVECRFPLYKSLGGVVFIDGGNVWYNEKRFGLDQLCWSAGTGLRLNLPLGVVRCDVGLRFAATPATKDPLAMIHFDIGQAF